MSRLRLAYLSPLPPQTTGIADYSLELLPHLAEHVDVEAFAPSPADPIEDLPLHRLRDFKPDICDLVVYQIGNSEEHHGAIFDLSLQHPGVVVMHEYMLHHLMRGLTLGKGKTAAFGEEMRYAYGETGRRAVEQFVDTGVPVDPWPFPLFERLVDHSLGVITHSDTVRQRILASRPTAEVSVVPHHLSIEGLESPDQARSWYAQHDIPRDAQVIGVFGFVTPQKRIDVVIEAFREIRDRYPKAYLVVVGAISGFYDIDDLRADAPARVVWTGRVEKVDLLRAMAGCDLAVNLRFPTGGETSGTAIRLLGLGKPLIASDIGWFSEVPDGCIARVPVGRGESESLVATLVALLEDRQLAQDMGDNAKARVELENSLTASARGYADMLERVYTNGKEAYRPVPPLALGGTQQVGPGHLDLMARAASDLGWPEDEPAMRYLAEVGVDLGLDAEVTLGSR